MSATAPASQTESPKPRLSKLNVRNFMRVSSASLSPSSHVTLISGKNGAGKTSLLNAIAALIGGAKFCPAEPIRKGQNKAEITGDFGPFVVTRTWTRSQGEQGESISTSLKVVAKDGKTIKSPQEMLSALFAPIALDPFGFVDMAPKDQVKALKDATGLTASFAELDAERERLYELRRQANQEVTIKRTQADTVPMVAGGDEEQSVASIQAEITGALAAGQMNNRQRELVVKGQERVKELLGKDSTLRDRIVELQNQLAAVEAELVQVEKLRVAGEQWVKDETAKLAALVDPDINALNLKMANLSAANAAVKQRRQHREFAAQLDQAVKRAAELDQEVNKLDHRKEELLSNTDMPVAGMAFTEEGVTLNGIPFAQSSTAQQLRAAVGVVAAQRPTLRHMHIHRGESLDDSSMTELGRIAEETDFDIWVERVTNGQAGVGFVIEDGEVLAPGGGK